MREEPATSILTRIVLVLPAVPSPAQMSALEKALTGGDIASILLYGTDAPEAARTEAARAVAALAQPKDVAVILSEDSRVAGRSGADGIHVEAGEDALEDAIDRVQKNGLIVGAGGLSDRHSAMLAAENGVDYVFFGKLDSEETEDPHPKTLALSSWWADLFETPVIALAGTTMAGIEELAGSGVDFIALRSTILDAEDPAAAVATINARLLAIHKGTTNKSTP